MTSANPAAALQSSANEQRQHERYVVQIPALFLDGTRGGIYAVTVLDVSTSGLRTTCPKDVPSGTRVEVKCQRAKILGTVRYARGVGDEFHLGIEADRVEAGAGAPTTGEIDLMALFRAEVTGLRGTQYRNH